MKPPTNRSRAGAWARANPQLRRQFILRAHDLVAAGVARLAQEDLALEQETTITGRLCEAMNEYLCAPARPDWCASFVVQEEVPVNDDGAKGKSRGRVDIEVLSVHGDRPVFSFEAKCLRDGHSVSDYTGREGMGCFVDARYARDFDFAGMLGYVCARSVDEWAELIEAKMDETRESLHLASGAVWAHDAEISALGKTRLSRHHRTGSSPIDLYHSLVRCTGAATPPRSKRR